MDAKSKDKTIQRNISQELQPLTDRQLLARFVAHRDEQAFRALVLRHQTVIWSICRRVLPGQQDREDVFQATFLNLVRQADRTGWQETIGSWLYKVAYRLALKSRRAQQRRQETELVEGMDVPHDYFAAIQRHDAELKLHEAILQLPRQNREAVVLCYLHQKSHQEAAAEIGCTLSALNGRLQRGRRQLFSRLGRQGCSVTLAYLALQQSLQAASNTLPLHLTEQTFSVGFAHLAGDGTVPISPQMSALCAGDHAAMIPTSILSKTMAVGGGVSLSMLLFLGPGLVSEAWHPGNKAYATPTLFSQTSVDAPPEDAEPEPELHGSNQVENPQAVIKSVSEELKSILTANQKVHEELLGRYQSVVAYNRRPEDLALNQDDLEAALPRLKKICRADSKRIDTVWKQLEQLTMQAGQLEEGRSELELEALETAAVSLQETIDASQEMLQILENIKQQMPKLKPKEAAWDLKGTEFSGLTEILNSNQQMLETVIANLAESPTDGQRAAIEQALNKLHHQQQALEQQRAEMELKLSGEVQNPNEDVLEMIRETLEKIRSVKVTSTTVSVRGQSTHYVIGFESPLPRRRKLALAELQKMPGLKILEAGAPNRHINIAGANPKGMFVELERVPQQELPRQ